jgi:hypothetical protein
VFRGGLALAVHQPTTSPRRCATATGDRIFKLGEVLEQLYARLPIAGIRLARLAAQVLVPNGAVSDLVTALLLLLPLTAAQQPVPLPTFTKHVQCTGAELPEWVVWEGTFQQLATLGKYTAMTYPIERGFTEPELKVLLTEAARHMKGTPRRTRSCRRRWNRWLRSARWLDVAHQDYEASSDSLSDGGDELCSAVAGARKRFYIVVRNVTS